METLTPHGIIGELESVAVGDTVIACFARYGNRLDFVRLAVVSKVTKTRITVDYAGESIGRVGYLASNQFTKETGERYPRPSYREDKLCVCAATPERLEAFEKQLEESRVYEKRSDAIFSIFTNRRFRAKILLEKMSPEDADAFCELVNRYIGDEANG